MAKYTSSRSRHSLSVQRRNIEAESRVGRRRRATQVGVTERQLPGDRSGIFLSFWVCEIIDSFSAAFFLLFDDLFMIASSVDRSFYFMAFPCSSLCVCKLL